MGCENSREAPYEPLPQAVPLYRDELATPMTAMGNPAQQNSFTSTMGSTSSLSTQHERLILELLPLKDTRQFHEWLAGPYVRGSWIEFCRDYLNRSPAAPEPDKQKVAQAAKDAINNKNAKYMVFHPQKEAWTAEDHTIRFIATVIVDNMIKNLWSDNDWKKKSIDITKAVYEVLSYLRATAVRAEQQSLNPPRYED
ncbi:hypothetical protein GQ53DRAFT_206959 [Thozetella sp. PMI_491]|nr:hypothetical protein GQ53DRAFT_206959 [Thozetella sp. PMI_491]